MESVAYDHVDWSQVLHYTLACSTKSLLLRLCIPIRFNVFDSPFFTRSPPKRHTRVGRNQRTDVVTGDLAVEGSEIELAVATRCRCNEVAFVKLRREDLHGFVHLVGIVLFLVSRNVNL